MPQYSYDDRNLLMAEGTLWSCHTALSNLMRDVGDTSFGPKVQELRDQAESVARELSQYNDQFEGD